jgi:hypothetical protein
VIDPISVLEDEELETRAILEPAEPRITEDLETDIRQKREVPELKVPQMGDYGTDHSLLPLAPTLTPNRHLEVICEPVLLNS